jgi:hypothetical protein
MYINPMRGVHFLHINIASIVLSQEFGGKYGLPKVARANEDLVISFFPNAEYDRELIIDQYLSTESKKLGEAILRKVCMEEYTAIVVANFKTDINPEEYIYKYKAKLKVPHFEIGIKSVSHTTLQSINEVAFSTSGSKGMIFKDILIKKPQKTKWWEDHRTF